MTSSSSVLSVGAALVQPCSYRAGIFSHMYRLPLTRGGLLHHANEEAWRRARASARRTALVPEQLPGHNKKKRERPVSQKGLVGWGWRGGRSGHILADWLKGKHEGEGGSGIQSRPSSSNQLSKGTTSNAAPGPESG